MRKLFGSLLILLLAFVEYGVCALPHEALFTVPADGIQVDLPSVNPAVVLRQRLVTCSLTFLALVMNRSPT